MPESNAMAMEVMLAGDEPQRLRLSCSEAWTVLRGEAMRAAAREPLLADFLHGALLDHDGLVPALAGMLARKLADASIGVAVLAALAAEAMAADGSIIAAACADLLAIYERDPAAGDLVTPFLYFKGYQALQWHRVGHWLWGRGRRDMALYLQSRVSETFAVDIHPAVPIGKGVFIDHATGIVVGETAVIGDDVSILQGVTLGGTGKETGDRHPKVRDGVLLAAGAKVLGNIEIGRNAKVGAGSVVLKDVPPCATVAGVPARIVGWCTDGTPALSMDQSLAADVR
jgi:serine O-acetyltransferase